MKFENQNGLTLIEVLLAWAIIAIFLAGAMTEQIGFLQKTRLEKEKRIAQWQVESMAERLIVNTTPASHLRELSIWSAQNKILLPRAISQLSCTKNHCNIQLKWGRGQHLELRI